MAKKRNGIVSYNYKEKEKRVSGRAIAAILLGFLSIALFGALLFLNMRNLVQNEALLGAAGFTGFAMAFIGMLEGLASFGDDCKSYFLSKIGTLLCGVLVAGWFLIFCIGLS